MQWPIIARHTGVLQILEMVIYSHELATQI